MPKVPDSSPYGNVFANVDPSYSRFKKSFVPDAEELNSGPMSIGATKQLASSAFKAGDVMQKEKMKQLEEVNKNKIIELTTQ